MPFKKKKTNQSNWSVDYGEIRQIEEEILPQLFPLPEEERKYILTSSYETALRGALWVADLSVGNEVVCSPFISSRAVNAVIGGQGIPVFADCDLEGVIQGQDYTQRICKRTKVIIVSHVFGNYPDWNRIYVEASNRGIHLIEDCGSYLNASVYQKGFDKTHTAVHDLSDWLGIPMGVIAYHPKYSEQYATIRNFVNSGEYHLKRRVVEGPDEETYTIDGDWIKLDYGIDGSPKKIQTQTILKLKDGLGPFINKSMQHRAMVRDHTTKHLTTPHLRVLNRGSSDFQDTVFRVSDELLEVIDVSTLSYLLTEMGVPTSTIDLPCNVHPFFKESFSHPYAAYDIAQIRAFTQNAENISNTCILPFSKEYSIEAQFTTRLRAYVIKLNEVMEQIAQSLLGKEEEENE